MARICLTEQQKREKALRVAVCRAKEEQGIKRDFELASAIGLSPSTYSDRKRESFQNMRLDEFSKMARVLKFTAKDLCDVLGVPYQEVST